MRHALPRSSFRPLALLGALLATSGVAPAQSFSPGDLYGRVGIGSGDAIVRIDRPTGTVTSIASLSFSDTNGNLAYCPKRQRLVTIHRPNASTPFGLYAVDSLGALSLLATTGLPAGALAPVGDGRVYFLAPSQPATPIRYLTASNSLQTLLDGSTGLPFVPTHPFATNTEGLTYDPITNALFFATRGNVNTGCSGGSTRLTVRRVQLSADGSQTVGAVQCVDLFDGSPFNGAIDPRQWDRLPDGRLLLVTSCYTTNPLQPSLIWIDPVTLANGVHASPNYATILGQSAGIWSSLEQRVLVLDTSADSLRSYASGTTGAGSPVVSLSANLVGIADSLVEIPVTGPDCPNALVTFGSGTPGCSGTQSVSANGCPKLDTPGFQLHCDSAPPSSLGLGIVTDVPDLLGSDPFAIGILLHAGFAGATEVIPLDFVSDAAGFGSAPAPIPATPILAGKSYFAIAIWAWSSCSLPPYGLSSSRGLGITIQP